MPKGPKGEKRPTDVIGAAVKVAKIATGEIEEDLDDDGKNRAATILSAATIADEKSIVALERQTGAGRVHSSLAAIAKKAGLDRKHAFLTAAR